VTTEEPFTISVDDAIIRVIGRAGFDIGSRYDRISIPFHAVQSDRYEARETVLVIDPTESVKGPQLRLHLRVAPPSKKLLARAVLSTLAFATLGFAALLPFSTLVRSLIVLGAVVLIAILTSFGLLVPGLAGVKFQTLTSGSAGGTSTPTATPAPPSGELAPLATGRLFHRWRGSALRRARPADQHDAPPRGRGRATDRGEHARAKDGYGHL